MLRTKWKWTLMAVAMLAAVLLTIGGCAAPPSVQTAQTVKAAALQGYLRNDAKIDSVVTELWKTARQKEIAATAVGVAAAAVQQFGVDRTPLDPGGKPTGPAEKTLTGGQAMELSQAILGEVTKANAGTAAVLRKIALLRNKNTLELTKYTELERGLIAYLQAGVEEAVLDELTKVLVQTLQDQATRKQ